MTSEWRITFMGALPKNRSQLSGLSFVLNNNLTEYKVIQVSNY